MKRFAHIAGILIALIAGGYFVKHAYQALAGENLSALLNTSTLSATIALMLVYAASIVTTAIAWFLMLRRMRQRVRFAVLLPILASTQFGKYLPGNVGQHIGRVALARSVGVQWSTAVFSVGYELILALVASAHLSSLILLWTPPPAIWEWSIVRYRWPLLILVTLGAIAVIAISPKLAAWLIRRRSSDNAETAANGAAVHLGLSATTSCYLLYASSFLLIGSGLWLVTRTISSDPAHLPSIIFFVGAFASSWILGFVAPGAPAGLGVREAIMMIWLGSVMPAAQAVLIVLALRIATTLGDLLNFLWGSAILVRQRSRHAFRSMDANDMNRHT